MQKRCMTSMDMAIMNYAQEYHNSTRIAPEIYRFLSLMTELQTLIKHTLIKRNPLFARKMY